MRGPSCWSWCERCVRFRGTAKERWNKHHVIRVSLELMISLIIMIRLADCQGWARRKLILEIPLRARVPRTGRAGHRYASCYEARRACVLRALHRPGRRDLSPRDLHRATLDYITSSEAPPPLTSAPLPRILLCDASFDRRCDPSRTYVCYSHHPVAAICTQGRAIHANPPARHDLLSLRHGLVFWLVARPVFRAKSWDLTKGDCGWRGWGEHSPASCSSYSCSMIVL